MPLEPKKFQIKMIEEGDTLTKLARKWKVKHPAKISRVIHRRAPFVYPEIRIKVARYMGVPVSDVGRPLADPEAEKQLASMV